MKTKGVRHSRSRSARGPDTDDRPAAPVPPAILPPKSPLVVEDLKATAADAAAADGGPLFSATGPSPVRGRNSHGAIKEGPHAILLSPLRPLRVSPTPRTLKSSQILHKFFLEVRLQWMLGASTLSPSQAITLTPDSWGKRALFTIHCHTLNLSTHFGVAHPKAGDDGQASPTGVDQCIPIHRQEFGEYIFSFHVS